jgi:hypothetical protein
MTQQIFTILAIAAISITLFSSSAFAFDPSQVDMTLTDAQTTSYDTYDIITLVFSLFNNNTESMTLSGHNMLYLNSTDDSAWEYTSHVDFPALSSTDCPVLNATIPSGNSTDFKQCFLVTNSTNIGYNLVLNNDYYMMDWETDQFVLESVPSSFKTTAGEWCSDTISESSFTNSTQSAILNGTINVMKGQSGNVTGAVTPAWVKDSACNWSNSLISEFEFLDGIYWLIDNGKILLE